MSVIVEDRFAVSNDTVLTSLGAALDPATVEQQFRRRLPLLDAAGGHQLREIEVIRYKPQRRCMIEYTLELDRPGGRGELIRLVGKVRARRFGNSGYRVLKTLWDAGFQDDSPDGISVPEPLGTVPKFRMWLQRKVPGESATRLMLGPRAREISARIAEAAYKLHRTGLAEDRKSHTALDEVRILRQHLPTVAATIPSYRHRIDAVLEQCRQLASLVADRELRTVHRDFYADQVIVDGSRLHLLDFDLLCRGDPAVDAGNFLGHLREQSLRVSGNAAGLEDVERSLQERFAQLHGEHVRTPVRIYTVLTLVRHVYLSTIFPQRHHLTPDLLRLCESSLDELLAEHAIQGRQ